jgi:hypothetical protein
MWLKAALFTDHRRADARRDELALLEPAEVGIGVSSSR